MTIKLTFSTLLLCITACAQTSPIPQWHLAGTNPKAYEAALDRETSHGGNTSAMIRCRERRCSPFATLMQTIQADEFMGRRVCLSGWVKATKGVSARLWMRVDGESSETLAFDNMDNRSKNGPFEWKLQTIVLDVDQPAALINFGLIVAGNGTGWVDDVTLEVVDGKVKSTNMVREPAASGNPGSARTRYYASQPRPANLDFEQPTAR